MFDAFISYSRKNSDYIWRVADKLIDEDISVWIDKDNIPISAEWLAHIFEGIENSHNFLFFVTPDSLASQVCHVELEHARKCNKSIIPVLLTESDIDVALATFASRPIDPIVFEVIQNSNVMQVASENYLAVKRFNWLYMTDVSKFDDQIKLLIQTIRQDLHYKNLHTRFGMRARLWEEKKSSTGYLLSRTEIEEAVTWLAQSQAMSDEEQPTQLQLDFITHSQQFLLKKRRQSAIGVIGTVLIALIFGVASVFAFDLLHDPLPYMDEPVNIAIADFALLVDTNGALQIDESGTILARLLGSQLDENLPEDLNNIIGIEAGDLYTILGATIEERRDNALELANSINAHILIYGIIDATQNPAHYQLFYHLADGFADGEELTGIDSFGMPVTVELPLVLGDSQSSDGNNALALATDAAFIRQTDILSNFLIGLAQLKEGKPNEAITWFKQAEAAGGSWADNTQTAAVVNYWTGVAILLTGSDLSCDRAVILNPFDTGEDMQIIDAGETVSAFLCAQSYYLQSLVYQPDYVRAQMGLANAYSTAAVSTVAGRRVIRCDLYRYAIDLYKQTIVSLSLSDRFDNIDLIRMKTYYNIGLTYTNIRYAPSCDLQDHDMEAALDALNRAIELYTVVIENPEAPKIATQAYYQIGLLHMIEGDSDQAIVAFDEVIEHVGDPEFYDEWHILEYAAILQKGVIARRSDTDLQTEQAILNFTTVIDAYPALHRDSALLAQALLNRAQAYQRQGQIEEAHADYCQALELETAPQIETEIQNSIDIEICS